jgi:hypothetical protein
VDLLEQVKHAFAAHDNKFATEKLAERIRQIVRVDTGWSLLKRSGLAALPSGSASNAAEQLTERLRDLGIHVVPVGEIEGFVRSIGGHGPDWVAAVLEAFSPDAEVLRPARSFVGQVLAGFSNKRQTTDALSRRNDRLVTQRKRGFRELWRLVRDFNRKRLFLTNMIIIAILSIVFQMCSARIVNK